MSPDPPGTTREPPPAGIIAALAADELEHGGVPAFWPALHDPGRLAAQNQRPTVRADHWPPYAHHTWISCHPTGRVLRAGRRLRAVGAGYRQCAALGRLLSGSPRTSPMMATAMAAPITGPAT